MNTKTKNKILAALDEVEEVFPFEDYITLDVKQHTLHLGTAVLKVTADMPNPKLLDIGCGPMNITAAFAKCGFTCFAVDDLSDPWHLADNNRDRIQDFAQLMGIQFHLQDATYHIPFDKESFDVVLLNSVIEHLHESPRELLNQAFGFLKTGGVVVISMPNSVNLRKRISVLLGKTNFPPIHEFYHSQGLWRGHVREYTLAETEYVVKESGGDVILSKTCHVVVYSKIPFRILRQIYIILTGIIPTLRDGLIVIARKPPGWTPCRSNKSSSPKVL